MSTCAARRSRIAPDDEAPHRGRAEPARPLRGAGHRGPDAPRRAQKAALAAITALRFGSEDYFFVLDAQGHLIANAFNAKNVGKRVVDQTDVPGGKRYFAEMVETATRDAPASSTT